MHAEEAFSCIWANHFSGNVRTGKGGHIFGYGVLGSSV